MLHDPSVVIIRPQRLSVLVALDCFEHGTKSVVSVPWKHGTKSVVAVPLEASLLKASPTDIRQVVVRVCVRLLRRSERTRWLSQNTPDEHPRRHRLADGPLSSL